MVHACNPRTSGAGSMSRRLSAASRRSFRPSWHSETLSYPPRAGKSRLDKQSPMKIYFVIVMWLNPFIMGINWKQLEAKVCKWPDSQVSPAIGTGPQAGVLPPSSVQWFALSIWSCLLPCYFHSVRSNGYFSLTVSVCWQLLSLSFLFIVRMG